MQVTSATFLPLLCSLSSEKFKEEPVKDELLGDVGVVYSYGPPFGSRLVSWPDLDRMRLNQQLLRRQAHANLAARLGAVKVHGQAPSLMLSFDGIESSLLLADQFWHTLRESVPGELVIGVPARDVVIVTGSESRAGLEKAKRAVDRVFFAGDDHLITRELLVRRGNSWEPLQRGAMARMIAVPGRRPSIPAQRPGAMPIGRPGMTGPHPIVPAARMGGRPMPGMGRPGFDGRRPDDTAARRALEDTGLRRALTDTGARRIIESRSRDLNRRTRDQLGMARDGAGMRRDYEEERPGFGVDLRHERPEPRSHRDDNRGLAGSLIGRRAGERPRVKDDLDADAATAWPRKRADRWSAADQEPTPLARSEAARQEAFRGSRTEREAQWWEVALRRYDPRNSGDGRRGSGPDGEQAPDAKPKATRSWSLAEVSRALANRDGEDDGSISSRWANRDTDADKEPAPWSLRAQADFLRSGLPRPRTAFEG